MFSKCLCFIYRPKGQRFRPYYSFLAMSAIIPLYGGLEDFGYYFADVLIGTPPQRMSVILDTGSEGLSVTCSTCSQCGSKHMDPFYNPAASKSFTDDNQCFARHNLRTPSCVYEKSYLEGSHLVGRFTSDTVSLGPTSKRIHFGCIESETRLFLDQKANGILGLAATKKTYWFSEQSEIFAFSICLGKNGGDLEFFTNDLLIDNTFVPLKYTANHYVVDPIEVRIDGDRIEDADLGSQVLFDSGSTVTYLNDSLFRKVVDMITDKANTISLVLDYDRKRDATMCWLMKESLTFSEISDVILPKITLVLKSDDSTQVPIVFQDYAVIDSKNRFCLRIASNGSLYRTDLGASFMMGKKIVFTPKLGKMKILDFANCTERPITDRIDVVAVPGQLSAVLDGQESDHVFEFFIVFVFLILATAFVLVFIVRKSVKVSTAAVPNSPTSQLE